MSIVVSIVVSIAPLVRPLTQPVARAKATRISPERPCASVPQVRLWGERLKSCRLLGLDGAPQTRATRLALLNRVGSAKISKLAVAVAGIDAPNPRNPPPMLLLYEGDGANLTQVRRLLLPEPVLSLEVRDA